MSAAIAAQATEASHSPRILIVEDDDAMRSALRGLLELRWLVDAQSDGQAALEAAMARPPDLVLSDVLMPRLDGFDLVRALRAHAPTATIPVILVSSRTDEDSVVRGLESGADEFLMKPFSGRELLCRVATQLELAKLRRRALDAASELAETRATLLRDLDRKNRELESFAYSVSHDLRAPLRAIDGFGQALFEDCGEVLDDRGKHYVDRIRAAAQRMGQLIDDLLHLSKVERIDLVRELVDVSGRARQLVEALVSQEPERQVEAVIQTGLTADADPRLLEIALENLLGNAWKFTRGSARERIELCTRVERGREVFVLADTGAGFDASEARRLFQPFQRLHNEREFPGSGIGLATVRRIVERHGGEIWADGRRGQGASFFFSFTPPTPSTGGRP